MKKLQTVKTLSLSKETVRRLDDRDIRQAIAGMDGSGAQTGCKPPYTCRTN